MLLEDAGDGGEDFFTNSHFKGAVVACAFGCFQFSSSHSTEQLTGHLVLKVGGSGVHCE